MLVRQREIEDLEITGQVVVEGPGTDLEQEVGSPGAPAHLPFFGVGEDPNE